MAGWKIPELNVIFRRKITYKSPIFLSLFVIMLYYSIMKYQNISSNTWTIYHHWWYPNDLILPPFIPGWGATISPRAFASSRWRPIARPLRPGSTRNGWGNVWYPLVILCGVTWFYMVWYGLIWFNVVKYGLIWFNIGMIMGEYWDVNWFIHW